MWGGFLWGEQNVTSLMTWALKAQPATDQIAAVRRQVIMGVKFGSKVGGYLVWNHWETGPLDDVLGWRSSRFQLLLFPRPLSLRKLTFGTSRPPSTSLPPSLPPSLHSVFLYHATVCFASSAFLRVTLVHLPFEFHPSRSLSPLSL